jgi:NADPH:quinone reductase-like Zn-dependent oxidoreductase
MRFLASVIPSAARQVFRYPAAEYRQAKKIDAVLDLVGNSVVLDSLAMLRRGGCSCLAGWLGGLDPIPDFNPLLQTASGVYLTFFGSFVFGTPGFPGDPHSNRDIPAALGFRLHQRAVYFSPVCICRAAEALLPAPT